MSHFSVLAVGFENREELQTYLDLYSEYLEVEPYISKSKEEVYVEWEENIVKLLEDKFGSHFTQSELTKLTKDIENQKLDVDYLLDRYSITQDKESKNFVEDYEKMQKNILDISTPQAYLESTYSPSEIDEDYNILSTYNLQTKFDYYDIAETYTRPVR